MHIWINYNARLEITNILQHKEIQNQFSNLRIHNLTNANTLHSPANKHDNHKGYIYPGEALEKIVSKCFSLTARKGVIYDKSRQNKEQYDRFLAKPEKTPKINTKNHQSMMRNDMREHNINGSLPLSASSFSRFRYFIPHR